MLAGGSCYARFEFANALGIAALAGCSALEFDSGGVGTILRVLPFAIEPIAALSQRMLGGLHRSNFRSAARNLFTKCGDLLLQVRLLRIHQRHAARQNDAKTAAQLIANLCEPFSL